MSVELEVPIREPYLFRQQQSTLREFAFLFPRQTDICKNRNKSDLTVSQVPRMGLALS